VTWTLNKTYIAFCFIYKVMIIHLKVILKLTEYYVFSMNISSIFIINVKALSIFANVIKYKWKRCSKKKCCKQCGQVKVLWNEYQGILYLSVSVNYVYRWYYIDYKLPMHRSAKTSSSAVLCFCSWYSDYHLMT